MKLKNLTLIFLLANTLSACGGGGSSATDSAGSANSGGTAPPTGTVPTPGTPVTPVTPTPGPTPGTPNPGTPTPGTPTPPPGTSTPVPPSSASYSASLSLASNSPSVSSIDAATLTLTNAGTVDAPAGLFVNMPPGLSASGFNSVCGGNIVASSSTQLSLTGAVVPAGGSCKFTFTINTPAPAYLPASNQRAFAIATNGAAGVASLTSATAPTISFLGSTPGLYSNTWFPSKVTSVAVLDMFITPATDPGPNSNVFWSNQMGGLGGYTGLQSTVLVGSEGVGKQFLFSLWGATNAKAGTPSSAGIGAGSYCTVSGTATDGSAGAQCRYRYNWQAGHTYRFRVTPNTTLGAGWFTSNVTDVTPGSAGDSFDIGSIFVGATQIMVPTTYISQWVEYFDWNSERTSCSSVPYTYAQFSVQATDTSGNAVTVPAPSVSANASCAASFANVSVKSGVATENGAPLQTAQGLFKANGLCLATQNGLTDGNPVGSNNAVLGTCPTAATVQTLGGSHFSNALWVWAADATIETENSYCLTSASATSAAGSAVILQTCVPGASNQQWISVPGPTGATGSYIQAKTSGMCLSPSGNALTLASCAISNAVWTPPGQSFSY